MHSEVLTPFITIHTVVAWYLFSVLSLTQRGEELCLHLNSEAVNHHDGLEIHSTFQDVLHTGEIQINRTTSNHVVGNMSSLSC